MAEYMDRGIETVSPALWIPTIWIFIAASRPLAAWFVSVSGSISLSDVEDGSFIDRLIFSILILLGIVALKRRGIVLSTLVMDNKWLILFLMYAIISISWSDFRYIAFKRLIRIIGSVIMVLIVVTDHSPDATKILLRRCAFLLIPLSVIMIKYFRHIGVGYNAWTGIEYWQGVTTDKNALGRLCSVCALAGIWDLSTSMRERVASEANYALLLLHISVLFLTLWLMIASKSATSLGCFIIAIGLDHRFGHSRDMGTKIIFRKTCFFTGQQRQKLLMRCFKNRQNGAVNIMEKKLVTSGASGQG